MKKSWIIPTLIVIILFLSSTVIFLLYQQNRLFEKSLSQTSQINDRTIKQENKIDRTPTDSPNETPDANDKTNTNHINEEFNYSFSCPGTVEEEEPIRPGLLSTTYCKIPNSLVNDFDEVYIKVFDTQPESIIEEIRTSGLTEKEDNSTVSGINTVVMSGYGGVGGSLYKEHYIFSYNEYTYQISFNIRLRNAEPDTQNIQQFMNSFTISK